MKAIANILHAFGVQKLPHAWLNFEMNFVLTWNYSWQFLILIALI